MIAINGRIIVKVNMKQKTEFAVGNVVYKTANKYEVNYREKSPVVAQVVSGNNILKEGDVILCHHNHYYHPSPYYLEDDLYSIPFNKTIFAAISGSGIVTPVCSNIIGSRVPIITTLPTAEQKKYDDRIIVTHPGTSAFKAGDLVFTRPSGCYDIVYIVNKIEYRITKVSEDQICGFEKKYYRNDKNL